MLCCRVALEHAGFFMVEPEQKMFFRNMPEMCWPLMDAHATWLDKEWLERRCTEDW